MAVPKNAVFYNFCMYIPVTALAAGTAPNAATGIKLEQVGMNTGLYKHGLQMV